MTQQDEGLNPKDSKNLFSLSKHPIFVNTKNPAQSRFFIEDHAILEYPYVHTDTTLGQFDLVVK